MPFLFLNRTVSNPVSFFFEPKVAGFSAFHDGFGSFQFYLRIKSENGTLDDSRYLNHLIRGHVCAANSVHVLSMFSCMFFRPEEYTFRSE